MELQTPLSPSVHERLILPPSELITGTGVVELFDDLTGKKQLEMPFENFIALPGQRWHKAMSRLAFGHGMPQDPVQGSVFNATASAFPIQLLSWPNNEGMPLDVFSHIAVTDNSDAEVPVSEVNPKEGETIVGWANRTVYSGADTKRGTPNAAESISDAAKSRWVFDWPTHAANGTFRSVEWLSLWEVTTLLPYSKLVAIGDQYWNSDVGHNYFLPMSGEQAGAHYNKDEFWMFGGSTSPTTAVVQRHKYLDGSLVVGSELTYATLGNFPVRSGQMDIATGDLWLMESASTWRIRRYTQAGGVVTTLTPAPASISSRVGVAWSGTKLWMAYSKVDGTYAVSEIDPASGAVLSTWTVPSATGIVWSAGSLYIWDGVLDRLYQYTEAGILVQKWYGTDRSNGTSDIWRQEDVASINFSNHFFGLVPTNNEIIDWGLLETLGARTRLPGDVTKSSLQTMKVTYQFNFT